MIGTKLEHFISGTEFCALNETIIMIAKKSNHLLIERLQQLSDNYFTKLFD